MKYLILLSLFLVGCSDPIMLQLEPYVLNEIRNIRNDVQEIKQSIKSVAVQELSAAQSLECVYFAKHIDTHAMASITIPVSGEYKIKYWSNAVDIKYVNAGKVLDGVQVVMRSTCPQYKDFK